MTALFAFFLSQINRLYLGSTDVCRKEDGGSCRK